MTPCRPIALLGSLALLAACASAPDAAPAPALHANGRTGLAVTGRDGGQFHHIQTTGAGSRSTAPPTWASSSNS